MGSSMFPDSGKPRYDHTDIPNQAGLNEALAYFRGFLGGGVRLAELLPILQSRYRPSSTIAHNGYHGAGFNCSLDEIERELTIQQLRFRAQITDRVENAIKCSRMVANIFAGAVVILEVTHLVRILQGW